MANDPNASALDQFMSSWGKLFSAVLRQMDREKANAILVNLQLGHAKLHVEFELVPLKMRARVSCGTEEVIFETHGGYDHIHIVPLNDKPTQEGSERMDRG
jgi:hypothetical protein